MGTDIEIQNFAARSITFVSLKQTFDEVNLLFWMSMYCTTVQAKPT